MRDCGNSPQNAVAVVGTGFIGRSWAHVFCQHGLETRLYDSASEKREEGYEGLLRSLSQFQELGLISPEAKETALSQARICESLEEAVHGATWIQENVPEDLSLKQRVFAEIDVLAAEDAIVASSVSALAMTDIVELTRRPERCLGVHPTNPPHIVPLVEIIKARTTAPEVVESARQFMEAVGQSPIVVQKEVPGYVLNRLQCALIREAVSLARHGVVSVPDIDRCLTDGLGLRWAFTGPYLVEELNAADVETCFRSYSGYYQKTWASLSELNDVDSMREGDVRLACEGVKEMLGSVSHEELQEWRNRMVLAIRELKRKQPMAG